MALVRFPSYDELMNAAVAVGFSVIEVEDLSVAVMPNLVRFENMARLFFAFPPLSKVLKWLVPEYFTQCTAPQNLDTELNEVDEGCA